MMLKALSPGAVGVSANSLEARVAAARDFGFDAVELDINDLARRIDENGVADVKQILGDVQPAGFGLPVDWRSEQSAFESSLSDLPRLAKAAQAIGCTRTATWILPGSNDLDLQQNRRFHVERFSPIASVLNDYGISLGLEFIGPKTLRDRFEYPFLYRSGEMLEMAHDIGPNVGLLLDCWHWYTSGGTELEILDMREQDVVYVHVNDAPAGVLVDAQVDSVRCLPGETGVIPIAQFMQALQKIGYMGPVVPEPFKQELSELPSDADRLRVVSESMDKIFRMAGLR